MMALTCMGNIGRRAPQDKRRADHPIAGLGMFAIGAGQSVTS